MTLEHPPLTDAQRAVMAAADDRTEAAVVRRAHELVVQHGEEGALKAVGEYQSAYYRGTPGAAFWSRVQAHVLAPPRPCAGHPAGQENECPEDCRACSGEACGLCGAGCWWSGPGGCDGPCDHDVIERHEQPQISNSASPGGGAPAVAPRSIDAEQSAERIGATVPKGDAVPEQGRLF